MSLVAQEAKCPRCRTKIQKLEGDFLFVKNAILRVDLKTSTTSAKCPRCKEWIEVPLRYEQR